MRGVAGFFYITVRERGREQRSRIVELFVPVGHACVLLPEWIYGVYAISARLPTTDHAGLIERSLLSFASDYFGVGREIQARSAGKFQRPAAAVLK
jgi:hypothetical protein